MAGRMEKPAMATTNPYADVPTTPDPFINRVRKDLLSLEAAKATDANLIAIVAKDEVLALWSRPVKTFIPVLALRAARTRLFPDASIAPPSLIFAQAEPVTVVAAIVQARDDCGIDMSDDFLDLRDDVLTVDYGGARNTVI
jgi:hypothetical protein